MRPRALFGAVCLSIIKASSAFSPDIRADTNHDGKVDLTRPSNLRAAPWQRHWWLPTGSRLWPPWDQFFWKPGNQETIPPYTSKFGVKYNAGRIIMGKHFPELPAQSMLDFLEAQRLRKPLILETGWLAIGHVDEFVQFLPCNNSLGWTVAIADTDTTSALAALKDNEATGHGGTLASSFKPSSGDESMLDFFGPSNANQTVASLIHDQTFLDTNEYAQRHIDWNLQVLLSEIDLTETDIVRVPTLFKDSGFAGSPDAPGPLSGTVDGLPTHVSPLHAAEKHLASFAPAAINGVVIGKHYLSPKPWGPVVNGADVIEEGVKAAYRRAGMSVTFIDDYLSHHVGGGEIHCSSNMLRETDLERWE